MSSVQKARSEMLEALAEKDDVFLEEYLQEGDEGMKLEVREAE